MRTVLLLVTLLVAGCGGDAPPARELVVYVPESLQHQVDAHLRAADIEATLVTGASEALTAQVIDKTDAPRADILITDNAVDIWRAGDRGALRPLASELLAGLPAELLDPDETWVALSFRPIMIHIEDRAAVAGLRSYADLGEANWAGKLCLVTSASTGSRALISHMIEDLGVKPAERIIRRWVRNLAAPPFASQEALQEAFGAQRCGVAVGLYEYGVSGARAMRPEPLYFDIHGIGVARHATSPDDAQAVVAELQKRMGAADAELLSAVRGSNASVIGWRDEEARLLAERAGYR